MKVMVAKCEIWKRKQWTTYNFTCLFLICSLVNRKIFTDSVSVQMNTIVSHDQFKPITIRENLVSETNYNCSSCLSRVNTRVESVVSENFSVNKWAYSKNVSNMLFCYYKWVFVFFSFSHFTFSFHLKKWKII